MRTLILFLLLVLVSLPAAARDIGLFVFDENSRENVEGEVINGTLIQKIPLKKVDVTHIVLRHDTEDKEQMWLECHLTSREDPGDFYFFQLKERDLRGFVVRPSEFHKDGCKWALSIIDRKIGETTLAEIAKDLKLAKEKVLNQLD